MTLSLAGTCRPLFQETLRAILQNLFIDDISTLYTGAIKISIKSHFPAVPVSQVSERYDVPQLASSICRMLELQDNGSSSRYWEYNVDLLLLSFRNIDVWDYFQIAIPAVNDYFKPEHVSIRCKAGDGQNQPRFTPIFVEINQGAIGIHCKSFIWLSSCC